MDEIKRKLARIEAQLAGHSLHERLRASAPLLFPALGLMVGILLQHVAQTQDVAPRQALGGPFGIWVWAGLPGLCVAAAWGYHTAARGRPHPHVLAYTAGLCFLCLGAIRLATFTTPASNDIRCLVGPERVLATVRGDVLAPPYQQRQDWCFAPLTFSDPATTFYLQVSQVRTDQGWAPARGVIRVHVEEPTLNLEAADRIQFDCWLDRFRRPTNPGQFDIAEYLARRNIYIGASVPSRDAIEPLQGGHEGLVTRLRGRLSRAVSQALLDGTADGAPAQGLLQALLLGSRRDIDRETHEAFRRTGLLHFVSLSGLHLGIFAWMICWLSKIAGLAKPHRALACIVATATFLMVVPPRAPTVRAAIIVWVYCLALILRRRTNPLNSLCLAAIILLLIRPTQLFEAGWQLSFASIAGILALTGRMQDFLPDKAPDLSGPRSDRARHFLRSFDKVGALFSTGVAAWLGGAGILLYHFFTITPLTAVWTVLVFPLVALILVAGFAKVIVFFLLPTLSSLLGLLVSAGADLLIWLVKLIAGLDINSILIGHVALWVPAAYYGLVLFALFARTRHVVLKKWLCVAWAVALVGYLGLLKWQRTHRDDLRLTVLDVGHGQAIVARLPGTKTVLFDAGSLYTPNVGARVVVPFLDYMGLGRLDSILISHNDIDHINGIPEIVASRRVDHVYANDAFFERSEGERAAQRLDESLAQVGRPIERLPVALSADRATVRTLWPPRGPGCPQGLSDNDRSLVSLIEFAGSRVLLCSDIEHFAQQQLMARHPPLHADVVISPHHGSPATLTERFIEGLQPRVVICSGSRTDYERSVPSGTTPPPAAFHTGRNGAIAACIRASNTVDNRILVYTYEGE